MLFPLTRIHTAAPLVRFVDGNLIIAFPDSYFNWCSLILLTDRALVDGEREHRDPKISIFSRLFCYLKHNFYWNQWCFMDDATILP